VIDPQPLGQLSLVEFKFFAPSSDMLPERFRLWKFSL
jgi:hypothetical protein